MIWSKEETLSRKEIEELQLSRLKETVKRVYEKVAPYRAKMDAIGVKPEDIKSLKDLAKLPFVTKQDMRDTYPFGLFAVPKNTSCFSMLVLPHSIQCSKSFVIILNLCICVLLHILL